MNCIKKCINPKPPQKEAKPHIQLTKQRSISAESKMDQLISSSTPEDQILFINKCKYAGIIPDKMARHMRHRLNRNATSALENLYAALCSQLKAERVQNIAEGYRYNSLTYAQLEANCKEFGLDVADIADYFEPVRHDINDRAQAAQLRDAVLGRRGCPLG
jgi:hypothetical protein